MEAVVTMLFLSAALAQETSAPEPSFGFVCTHDAEVESGLGLAGVPPLTVNCVLEPPAEGTWSGVSWTFGDGASATGDAASFTYEEVGQFTIAVELLDYRLAETDEPVDAIELRPAYVTVCGPPEPEFTVTNKGGLLYQLRNETAIAVYCLDTIRWELFRGDGARGEPELAFDTWEPRVELPSEGPWTIVLKQSGMAGEASAQLALEAKFQLTDDWDRTVPACATGSGGAASLVSLGALAFALRRRRT